MSDFRSSTFLEKYDYVTYDLDTPIVLPVNTQVQKTKGYRFSIDNTNETSPYDWYNSYIEVDFQVQKLADGTAYAAADRISTVNSIYSAFKRVSVNFNGTMLNDSDNINQCTNLKNLLYYSEPHKSILSNSFYYLDETDSTVVDNADFAAIKAANFKVPSSFQKRHNRIIAAKTNNVILSLNRYGFFESLENEIAPQGRVTISIELEASDNLIYLNTGTAAPRFVIMKMKLHIPKLIFNSQGEQLFLKSYLNPHEWTYIHEHLEISPSTKSAQGTFLISSAISKPRHVFIWAINDANYFNLEGNIFHYNTFSIADGKKCVSAQLEVGSGNFYPVSELHPNNEMSIVYRMLMSYNKSYNDNLTGSQITRKTFEEFYSIIYFDLRNQPISLRNGTTKLSFKWRTDGVTNANFSWHALVLSEETIRVVSQSGKVFLKK